MKKRMFITTIVMMLVLAVALTTSSLAWFSSANTTVTANAATFTAATASSSALNLKISDSTDSWGNSINLLNGVNNTGTTMVGVIPTDALISKAEKGADWNGTGVIINNATTTVSHKGYVWPARMNFNAAAIGDESNFIIDTANPVQNIAPDAADGTDYTEGVFYREFYLHNSGEQNAINALNFKLTVGRKVNDEFVPGLYTTGTQAGDYTSNAYAAFIIFDLVNVSVDGTVPSNALNYAEYTVKSWEFTGELGAKEVKGGKVQTAGQDTDSTEDDEWGEAGLNVWVPFAAFSMAVDKAESDPNKETDWQFADLDHKTNEAFDYNNKQIDSLPTQQYEVLSGAGFTLNDESLRALNNKVAKATATGKIKAGSVRNSGEGYVRTTDVDTTSTFIMQPGETYLVGFYYWLDGLTMTAFTDTTVSTISLDVSAS